MVALQGGQGKPRPALVVQADHFADLTGMTVLPITGTLLDAPLLRVEVEPSARNGPAKRSQIMVASRKPRRGARSARHRTPGRCGHARGQPRPGIVPWAWVSGAMSKATYPLKLPASIKAAAAR